ncbi:hypothetical protein PQQ51_30075 [Paraburkholderia xenovorans]|uniref:hypothetical protein n=1 Tax=Paraburkholderia xenovorans TaxID=36873 RepID=UPI0038BA502F
MNKPSERIVVFVTTAQKRAIAATAENLGISVSELMRRAVLSFGATSEQVKAASIVDRLRAPRAPDALDAALQRVARGTRHARAAQPPLLQTRDEAENPASTDNHSAAARAQQKPAAGAATHNPLPRAAATDPAPLLPADVLAALAADADEEAVAAAEAVARVAAAKAAAVAQSSPEQTENETPLRSSVFKRPRLDSAQDEDGAQSDPSAEGGRFA